jgi:ADP-heptose:LPS heptosyltransferase
MLILFKKLSQIFSTLITILFRNEDPNIIVIFSFHFLGDTVSTLPAIELIKNKFPAKTIYIFCYPASEVIYRYKYPDFFYKTYKRNEINLANEKIGFRFLKLFYSLRKLKPSIVFDITSSFKTAFLSSLSGAKNKVGFGNPYLKGFFTHFVNRKVDQHVSHYYLTTVSNFLKTDINMNYEIFKINYNPKDHIMLIPFAGWKAKEWSLINFLRLAEDLNKDYKIALLAEQELVKVEIESELKRKGITLIKNNSISDLIENLKGSSLLISNDTGPILIAGLLGKPTFSLYGPTNPLYHKASGDYHDFIHKTIKCSPRKDQKLCFTFGGRRGCPSFECMRSLKFDDVIAEVKSFIINLKITPKNY